MNPPDSHRVFPERDDHRRSPLLPPIVVVALALGCMVAGCIVLLWR